VTLNGRMTVVTAVACVLASTALLPLFSDSLWFAIAIGAVIVVAAAGALTRLRTLPAPVCLAGSVAGLLLYLNLVFEARHSLLFVIPTPGSLLRLFELVGSGITDSKRYAPAVPNLPGLLLLAAGGVGIAAVTADLIAVRLRSTALAGLPLLVLFTVPVTMNASHDQLATGLVFSLGGAGYLAMLSADGRERIRVWGRLVSLWRPTPRHGGAFNGDDERADAPRRVRGRGPGPDTRALAAAGRRVGLASIVLALCAPLLLPGLHPSKLFSSGPGIGGNGDGSSGLSLSLSSALNETVTQLHESRPSTVFTYTTSASAAEQDNDAEYFRQYVFDTLGEQGWQVDDYSARTVPIEKIPDPPGLTDTTSASTLTTTVNASRDFPGPGSQPTFLPLPYPAIHVYALGKWLADPDLMVYSTSDSIAGQSYSVASVAVDPNQTQLESVPALVKTEFPAADLQLPSSYRTPALKNLADTYTAGQTSEFGKVDALATWLSGGQYNLTVTPLNSAASLVNFLTKTRSGFCVQYAYAMTVLARLLGIPARFVVGYTAGTRLKNGSYQVRNTDAHAWTEVYFPTFGWIRFEPTPAGQGTANPPNYMTSGTGHGQLGNTPPIVGATIGPGKKNTTPSGNGLNHFRPQPGAGGSVAGSAGGRAGTPWTAIALAVTAALVLALALITIIAPAARRTTGPQPETRHRRPTAATITAAGIAATALVALALYRLMARTPGVNLGVGWATIGIAFAATAAATLITPAAFRLTIRRWRWIRARDDTSRAHAAWRDFHDDLTDFGVTSPPSEPPRTLAARVTTTLPAPAAAAVTRLALAEERASYAARPTTSQHLRHDGTTARRGLAATARRTTRWRATIFPASMMTTLTQAATRIPDRAATLRPRHHTHHKT
jgi:transglutaminase-like putative cysteine protease